MGQELAIRSDLAGLPALLPTSIEKALAELKISPRKMGDEPLIAAEDRGHIPALLAECEKALEPVDRNNIPAIIGYLSVAFPSRERAEVEDRARLRHYVDGLDDLPEAVLQEACRIAVRKSKFMPTVAELREFAGPALGVRRWHKMALTRLAERFDAEEKELASRQEPMPPAEAIKKLGKLAKQIEKRFPSKRVAA